MARHLEGSYDPHMTYIARPVPSGQAGVDLLAQVSSANAAGFKAAGKGFVLRYGAELGADEPGSICEQGLGLGILSRGRQSDYTEATGKSDSEAILDHLRSIGVPVDALTIGLDLETPRGATAPELHIYEGAFAANNVAASCTSGVYVGAGLLMSSTQLYDLAATRYYNSGSRIVDAAGNAAEPECGYTLTQVLPFGVPCGGTTVDLDFSGEDFHGRSWWMLYAVPTGTAFSIPG